MLLSMLQRCLQLLRFGSWGIHLETHSAQPSHVCSSSWAFAAGDALRCGDSFSMPYCPGLPKGCAAILNDDDDATPSSTNTSACALHIAGAGAALLFVLVAVGAASNTVLEGKCNSLPTCTGWPIPVCSNDPLCSCSLINASSARLCTVHGWPHSSTHTHANSSGKQLQVTAAEAAAAAALSQA
jgi:hypothetical protein